MVSLKTLKFAALCLLPLSCGHPVEPKHDDLLIQTDIFTAQGITWPNTSDVRFFGNLPYAEPPIGSARFRPPIAKRPSNQTIDASWFGPSCIQFPGPPTVFTEFMQEYLLAPGQEQSEDCLTLNIFAPKVKAGAEKLPVMIWLHDGAYWLGGSASPFKYGHRFAKNQNVVVVTINYRLNIFGFPNAAALNGSNVNPGLLDQRKAVEWIFEHISAFGGDPDRMVLFGQSAGAMSVDRYAYAYPTDPIVKGFIAQSGTALSLTSVDLTNSNFTYVADQFGCASSDRDDEFACMQRQDSNAIIEALNQYNATANEGRSLSFTPAADEVTSFSNYTDLQIRGLFARLPTLLSSTDDDGSSTAPFVPTGPEQATIDLFTLGIATCPTAQSALARRNFDVPVWRARYFGQWPNLNPLPWLGAYHASDIPMIWGTSDLRGPNTAAQVETSNYMQAAWAAFARDPEHGLKWPMYDPNADTLVKLAFENNTKAVLGPGNEFDALC